MTEDHSFELASQAIGAIGDSGAAISGAITGLGSAAFGAVGSVGTSAFNAIGDIGKSAFSSIDNAITSFQNIKLKKLDNDFKQLEFSHLEKMQKSQNEHEQAMLQERNRHEEFIISEQRKVFEKIMETANAAYKEKIDFVRAQLVCLNETYNTERELLSKHISYLEAERTKVMDDANKYMMISNDLSKLEDQKSELYGNFMNAQGKLNDAIKYLEIDKSFSNSIENSQKNLLGNSEQ